MKKVLILSVCFLVGICSWGGCKFHSNTAPTNDLEEETVAGSTVDLDAFKASIQILSIYSWSTPTLIVEDCPDWICNTNKCGLQCDVETDQIMMGYWWGSGSGNLQNRKWIVIPNTFGGKTVQFAFHQYDYDVTVKGQIMIEAGNVLIPCGEIACSEPDDGPSACEGWECIPWSGSLIKTVSLSGTSVKFRIPETTEPYLRFSFTNESDFDPINIGGCMQNAIVNVIVF